MTLLRLWFLSGVCIFFILLLFGDQNYMPLKWWECIPAAIIVPPIIYAAYIVYRKDCL